MYIMSMLLPTLRHSVVRFSTVNMSDSDQDIFITQNKFSQSEKMPNFQIKNDIFPDVSEDEMSDKELLQVTQKTEEALEKENAKPGTRFQIVTDECIQKFVSSAASSKTVAKTNWAVRLFTTWKNNRNAVALKQKNVEKIEKDLLTMTNEELNNNLARFVMEVKNAKGEEYRGNTIYEIITSIQHDLRDKGRKINFIDDDCFQGLRKVLDAKMKLLAQQGIGIHKRQPCVITLDQEEKLWNMGILGTDTPKKLLDTLLYTLGLNLALRAGQEHRNLRVGRNSQLSVVSSGERRYMQYTEDVSKTNTGGLNHRKLQPKTTRVYENLDNPERFPVNILEKYLSLRPKDGKCTALYLRPLKYTHPDCWYADMAVGIHQLSQTVGRLCQEAKFEGFYSNHSLRATAATRLYVAGVDEQLIAQKTGHRSSAIRDYKRTNEQLVTVSDLLQSTSNKIPKLSAPEASTSSSTPKEINIQAGNMNISMKC